MSDNLKDYEQNPEMLKLYLDSNRANGFPDLDVQHKAFICEFLKTYDRNQAADEIGIARSQTMKILRDPLAQEFMRYLQEQKQHYSLISAAFIEVQQLNLLGKLLGEEEVAIVDKDGTSKNAKKFHASESVALLRDMSKNAGLVDDSVKVKVNNVNLNGVELTPEQQQLLDAVLDGKF